MRPRSDTVRMVAAQACSHQRSHVHLHLRLQHACVAAATQRLMPDRNMCTTFACGSRGAQCELSRRCICARRTANTRAHLDRCWSSVSFIDRHVTRLGGWSDADRDHRRRRPVASSEVVDDVHGRGSVGVDGRRCGARRRTRRSTMPRVATDPRHRSLVLYAPDLYKGAQQCRACCFVCCGTCARQSLQAWRQPTPTRLYAC